MTAPSDQPLSGPAARGPARRHPRPDPRGAGEGRLRAQRLPALAHRPDEFRAFFAYHDALMLRDSGLTKGEREMIVVATSGANDCLYCVVAHGAILRIYEKNPLRRRPGRGQLPQGRHHAAPARDARLRDQGRDDSAAIDDADFAALRDARLQRRRRLGHRRHRRVLRPVEPDGQRHRDAAERRVLPDGPRAHASRSTPGLARQRATTNASSCSVHAATSNVLRVDDEVGRFPALHTGCRYR